MMKYWNALFNRGTKEAKKAFEANMHLTANCCEKRFITYFYVQENGQTNIRIPHQNLEKK